jgi:hypothetical protein
LAQKIGALKTKILRGDTSSIGDMNTEVKSN